jgi:hypothetical protein
MFWPLIPITLMPILLAVSTQILALIPFCHFNSYLLKSIVRILFKFIPFNYSWVDLVHNFEQNLSVSALFTQTSNANVFQSQRVDPESECSLFFGSFNIIVNNSGFFVLFLQFLSERFQSVINVEDVRRKDRVQLSVAFLHVFCSHDSGHSHFLSIV